MSLTVALAGSVTPTDRGRAPRPLSGQLARWAARSTREPVRLGDLVEALHLRGYHALLVLLAFPFVTPVPLPGFSFAFGVVIALLGFRMALGQPPWLPRRLTERPLPPRSLPKLLLGASRVFRRLERFVKPRLLYPRFPSLFQRIGGVLVAGCGLLLLLPVPLPFTNALPALAIVLLGAAGLAQDGAVFLAGCLQTLLCVAVFAGLALGGSAAWERFCF